MGQSEGLFKCCCFSSDASCISNNASNMSHLPFGHVVRLSFHKQAKVKSGRLKSAIADVTQQGRHSLHGRLGLCHDTWEFFMLQKSQQHNLHR